MTQSQIVIHHLHYTITPDKPLFASLSLTFDAKKIGLVGRNGIGKSTLLKLILGELLPDTGSIQIQGKIAYCPQQPELRASDTVADLLDIRQQTEALTRITQGSLDEKDFQLVGDDWLIEERTRQQLSLFGLDHLTLDQLISTLSGGEKTRLHLAKVFLAQPDFIILDEPTNNLDNRSRQFLYQAIVNWKKGLLVVSHDRTLLDFMDQMVEITSLGVNVFGGNYTHYHEQKNILKEAAENDLFEAKKSFTKTKKSIQINQERHEKKKSYGRKLFLSGKIDKLTARSKQGRSENTQNRLTKQNETLIENALEKLHEAKLKIDISQEIHITLPNTYVPNGKMIVDIKNLDFAYLNQPLIIKQFNLKLIGPERIALMGENGSGKTTLIKILLGKLKPLQGSLSIGVNHVSYLSQNATSLNPELNLIDNFLNINKEAKLIEAHHALAQFLFRNITAQKLVKYLSGGEKLRAELACNLLSKNPPQLLILDEPTNHLDLDSLVSVETALNHYQGALLVISHDQQFLENIHVNRVIYAPFIPSS